MTNDSRAAVLVFATGGTIGMRGGDAGLAPDPAFPEALDRLVTGICGPLGITPRVNHFQPALDSANADAETATRIARAVRARVRTQRPRGVVITHGTDTLAHTASRLAFELADLGSPVVLTGSQLPHGAPESDAVANLSLAIRASMRAAADAPVSIAFGGLLLPAVRATKRSSTELAAFEAPLDLAPRVAGIPAGLPADPTPATHRVISFRFVPGVTAADLTAAAGGGPDGLVLECYGSGTGPTARPGVASALRDITAARPVVAVSQCATGGVDLARYAVGRDLAAAGVLDGGDLTLEAALAKLGFLLDRGARGAELRALMSRNLVGELTPGDAAPRTG